MTLFKNTALCIAITSSLLAAQTTYADQKYNDIILLEPILNTPFKNTNYHFAMVCNVDGPDGFLSVRAGPGTKFKIKRNLKKLAGLMIKPKERKGDWIPIDNAQRFFSTTGKRLKTPKSLFVQGWAHADYICDYKLTDPTKSKPVAG